MSPQSAASLAGPKSSGWDEWRALFTKEAAHVTWIAIADIALVPATCDASAKPGVVYQRVLEHGTLYEVVRDNLQTLCAAIVDGFASPLSGFVRDKFGHYLDWGTCRETATGACKPRQDVAIGRPSAVPK